MIQVRHWEGCVETWPGVLPALTSSRLSVSFVACLSVALSER